MQVKPLYSVVEVARHLNKHVRTVQRMIRDGELDAVTVRGRRYVPLAALQANVLVWESIQRAGQDSDLERFREALQDIASGNNTDPVRLARFVLYGNWGDGRDPTHW